VDDLNKKVDGDLIGQNDELGYHILLHEVFIKNFFIKKYFNIFSFFLFI
jgi:hypothetical protein